MGTVRKKQTQDMMSKYCR